MFVKFFRKWARFALKTGVTYVWYETGTEGIAWSVYGGQRPYDFHALQAGDVIVVRQGGWVFIWFIIPDYRFYPFNWSPFGVSSERWKELFFQKIVLPDGSTRFSGEDASLPALVFTFPPLTAIAKVLQRMLTEPPNRW